MWILLKPPFQFPRNPTSEPEVQQSGDSQCRCASIDLSTAGPPEKVESEASSDELPDCQRPQITNVQTENRSKSMRIFQEMKCLTC